jgi:hypothetical protein
LFIFTTEHTMNPVQSTTLGTPTAAAQCAATLATPPAPRELSWAEAAAVAGGPQEKNDGAN